MQIDGVRSLQNALGFKHLERFLFLFFFFDWDLDFFQCVLATRFLCFCQVIKLIIN